MTATQTGHLSLDDYRNFVGRRTLVNKIYARIGAGRPQSVSIVGDSRIGKSALLRFLAHEETRRQYLADPEEYIYLYISCRELNPVTLENFTRILFKLSEPYAKVTEETDHSIFNYNYYKHLVESLHRDDKKIILFLDDFNLITLNPAFPLEFFSFLRSLANNYNMAYVTTSYEDLQKLCVSKDIEESPFFNIFTNMSLKGFDDAELDQFLTQICPADRSGDTAYKNYLTGLAGRFPFPLLRTCELFQHMSDDRTQLEQRLYEELQEHFQIVWDRLETAHRDILKGIVAGDRLPDAQQYLLRDLNKKNYIILDDNSGAAIDGRLFRNFIARRAGVSVSDRQTEKPGHGLKYWLKKLLGRHTAA